jgi:hypothetical protein
MSLPDQLPGRVKDFQNAYQKLKELNGKLLIEDFVDILGPGFSYTSIQRLIKSDFRGYGNRLKDKTMLNKLPFGIRQLEAAISKYTAPVNSISSLYSAVELNRYHQFQLWWWDPHGKVDLENQRLSGKVIDGILKLPFNWEGEGASLVLPNEEPFSGFAWSRTYHNNNSRNVSVRFTAPGKSDLLMLFNIEDEQKLELLTGSFVSADPLQFNPRHGSFYLTADVTVSEGDSELVQSENKLKSSSIHKKIKKGANNKSDFDTRLIAKIRQNLFHQTFETRVGSMNALPDHIHSSHDTLINEFVNRYFVGHFINTSQAKLESFILSVDSDGRVTVKYENFKVDYGHFRLFHDNIVRMDLDFDSHWKAFRYRFYFDRQISQKPWYFGFGAGAEKVGHNIFMNRVAMKEVRSAPQRSLGSISLKKANHAKINERLNEDPILRDYLSGSKSDDIFNNDMLTETTEILRLAGLLKE